jgi:hypothetical protein
MVLPDTGARPCPSAVELLPSGGLPFLHEVHNALDELIAALVKGREASLGQRPAGFAEDAPITTRCRG